MDFSYQGFSVGSGIFNYDVAGATNLGSLSSYNNYNLIDQFYNQNALGDKVINNATAVEIYDLNATDTGINDFDIDQAMEYLKNNLSEEDFYRLFHSFQFFDFDSLSEEDKGNLLNYWVDCLETNNFIELNGTDFA